MNWYEIEFQGRSVRVPAIKAQGKLWFHWLGLTYSLELEKAGRKAGASGKGKQSGVITAPMPGKITRVAVQPGANVEIGQALIVMEAMKMEYTLQAEKAGRISEVNAEVGAQVALGAVLAKIEDKK